VVENSDNAPRRDPRYWRTASHGPRILFFTGGSALRGLSRRLKLSTWNSIHIVTPFDSGGSSAEIRHAFHMPSVGDLRNRLLALADEGSDGDAALFHFLAFRLPEEAEEAELRVRLASMVDGEDDLIEPVPEPVRSVMRELLGCCAEALPESFRLRGASIGNLVLAGGYLREDRSLARVIDTIAEFAQVRGIVRPVTEEDLQLGAVLKDGREVVGQHLLTGKAAPALDAPIRDLFFVRDGVRSEAHATDEVIELIASADMIVYPMGSLFSSVLCNLMPVGVGKAIVASDALKVFIPNVGRDPEQLGVGPEAAIEWIESIVRRDAGAATPREKIVGTVILDPNDECYADGNASSAQIFRLSQRGLEVLRLSITDEKDRNVHDSERLAEALLSLA